MRFTQSIALALLGPATLFSALASCQVNEAVGNVVEARDGEHFVDLEARQKKPPPVKPTTKAPTSKAPTSAPPKPTSTGKGKGTTTTKPTSTTGKPTATADAWKLYAGYCEQGGKAAKARKPKRDLQSGHIKLQARAPPAGYNVASFDKQVYYAAGYGKIGQGVYTEGLVTCIGVVVTGESDQQMAQTLHVLHVPSYAAAIASEWEKFEKGVKGANLKNLKGTISTPDLAGPKPSVRATWSDAVADICKTNNADLLKKLEALVGASNVSKKTHNMAEAEKGENNQGILAAGPNGQVYSNTMPPAAK